VHLEKSTKSTTETTKRWVDLSSVKDHVDLVYDCPKSGDAIYYNPSKNGWDLASAELDNSNYFDTERLIESLAIVEKVLVECKEGDTENNRHEARVVFFGKSHLSRGLC
jgi:hypothetical protein